MAATPLINGTNYSWANVTLVWYGIPVVGIMDISYKKKTKKENNYGVGSDPVSRGYGNNEFEASVTIYLDEWNKIVKAAAGNDPLSIPPQDIQVVYGGSRVSAKTDVLQQAEAMEDPIEVKQGDTKIAVKIPLLIAGILHK